MWFSSLINKSSCNHNTNYKSYAVNTLIDDNPKVLGNVVSMIKEMHNIDLAFQSLTLMHKMYSPNKKTLS